MSRRTEQELSPIGSNIGKSQTQPDSLESIVTEIWESVLGIKPIRVDEDFLDAGGDSIMALIIAGRIQQVFEVDIPLPMFFEYMTISEMTNMIFEARGSEQDRQK